MKMPHISTSPKLRTGLAITLTGAALAPGSVQALGIRVPGQDAFAIARGNAFVATADNPSAIYYNPAGITQLTGHNFSFGANVVSVSSRYTSPTGAEFDTDDKINVLPQFYYTFSPENMPVSFGLGFYSPFGLGIEWPDQTPYRQLSLKGEMAYATINPVVAWKIRENISIGAGATINYADTTLTRGLTPAGFPPAGNRLEFNGNGWSVGFNFGVRWEITERHSVGATYRSANEMSFSGDTFISLPAPVTLASSADFQLPQNVTVGYSFRPNEKWNVEVNVDWTDWESLDNVVLQLPFPPGNLNLPFNWQSSWMMMFGGTRYLENDWNVSAGYIFSQNSVPDDSFNPGIPDSNRHVFSAGFGKQINQVSIDAAIQYGYGPTRTLSNAVTAPNAAANGDYVFHSISLVLAVGYSF